MMRALDLFSCIGCHAIGFERAGIETGFFCEINPWRRTILARRFPKARLYEAIQDCPNVPADIVIGGPPCKATSVAAAVHGRRSGESLWPWMLSIGINSGAEWIVVEQPPGNAAWEAQVCGDLSEASYHVARFEFGACDIGAPYIRRRVFLVACTHLSRLAVAWKALPSAVDCVKRAATARGDWDAGKLGALRVDARASGEMQRSTSRARRERIEALGDSNPPHMAEVIGRVIVEADRHGNTTVPA